MALVTLDLDGAYAITQGYEWRVNLYYPGNINSGNLSGQIWEAYVRDSALAQFTFERAVYNQTDDYTKIPAILDKFKTGNLIPTTLGFYVYEIKLSRSRLSPIQLLAGKVIVNPSLEALR